MNIGGKWAITGVAGFIGSNVAEHLISSGRTVVGLDNLSTGRQKNIERLNALEGDFAFVKGDIRDQAVLNKIFGDADTVLHLAAQGQVQRSVEDPVETEEINVAGFLRVLQATIRSGVRRFIYASSCSVYGDNPSMPLSETTTPAPKSPYAVSKLANELYGGVFADNTDNLNVIGLRLFNIFGPWQDPKVLYAAVIPKWIGARLRGETPVMYGAGDATRDFCHVNNVICLLGSLESGEGFGDGPAFNIGTGKATSLTELDGTILDALAKTGAPHNREPCIKQPWRQGDILHSVSDIGLARSVLGYSVQVGLADGIRQILEVEYKLGDSKTSDP